MPQNFVEPARVRVMEKLPALGETEIGELIYTTSDNRLNIRIIAGWKYAGFS